MKRFALLFTLFTLLSLGVHAQVTLPALVGDNMVLQRNTTVNLWGRAPAHTTVTLTPSWNQATYTCQANSQGKWQVAVPTSSAGGPYTLTLKNGSHERVLSHILLGEVWISSGQSNMEFPVCGFVNQPCFGSAEAVLESVQYPDIRLFEVIRVSCDTPQEDCPGSQWLTATYDNVARFSAVSYFFAKELNRALGIPIGIITTNWGGSSIEAWMSEEAILATQGIHYDLCRAFDEQHTRIAGLYNGMLTPLFPFTAKGFIWYQGETNRPAYFDYDKLMVSLVRLWREKWGNDHMPFYYVQLAPYRYNGEERRTLPLTVEAQYKALAQIPYSGIAATTDLGHTSCIHPPKKIEVGQRLAFLALANDYGVVGLPAPAPTFKSMSVEDNVVTVRFNHLSDGSPNEPNSLNGFTETKVRPILGFEIAGADQKFYPAKGNFLWWQNAIQLRADEVPHPVAVRYAFTNVPNANVVTTYGQPLVPFRTDDWEIPESEL